ncbi:MAG: hypothetical protein U0903_13720 [Planctomycetales bacterium]
MDWQWIIVLAAIGWAIFSIGSRIRRWWSGAGKPGCHDCPSASPASSGGPQVKPFVSLDQLRASGKNGSPSAP